eukprot:Awhi_evm1s12470
MSIIGNDMKVSENVYDIQERWFFDAVVDTFTGAAEYVQETVQDTYDYFQEDFSDDANDFYYQ